MYKNNRNTLSFLKETQQYINNICKPINPEEINIIPRKPDSRKLPRRNSSITSKDSSLALKKKHLFRDDFLNRRRRRKLVIEDDDNKQRKCIRVKSQILTPINKVSSSPNSSVIVRKYQ